LPLGCSIGSHFGNHSIVSSIAFASNGKQMVRDSGELDFSLSLLDGRLDKAQVIEDGRGSGAVLTSFCSVVTVILSF